MIVVVAGLHRFNLEVTDLKYDCKMLLSIICRWKTMNLLLQCRTSITKMGAHNFILLPQFALTGIADNFVEIAKMEIFYDQAPEGMKSLGTAYFTTSLGLGSFLSTFLLTAVANISQRHSHTKWILNNLNISRLDYYYVFMAVLSLFNFLFFVVVAKFFVYNVDVTQKKYGLEMIIPSSQDNARIRQSTPQPDAKS